LQLSNASGSFANPVNVGTLSSFATSGTIVATIPANTPVGNGYKLRINTSVPVSTGAASVLSLGVRSTITDAVELCAVSVDSATGKNKLIWNKPVSNNIDSFVIYRSTSVALSFDRIAAQAYNGVLSTYIDATSAPSVLAQEYYIKGKNACGETPISNLHRTMHLTINKGQDANTWNLIWNGYQGVNHHSYEIWRGSSPATMTMIFQIAMSDYLNSYTDFTAPTGTVYYMIKIADGPTCTPTLRTTGSEFSITSNIATNAKGIELTVYPNPSSGAANVVVFSKGAGLFDLQIADVTGRNVEAAELKAGEVASFGAALAPGVYTVRVTDKDGNSEVKKWIKQ
jgi:hypothetical protein